jgi:hypothetical protein
MTILERLAATATADPGWTEMIADYAGDNADAPMCQDCVVATLSTGDTTSFGQIRSALDLMIVSSPTSVPPMVSLVS